MSIATLPFVVAAGNAIAPKDQLSHRVNTECTNVPAEKVQTKAKSDKREQ